MKRIILFAIALTLVLASCSEAEKKVENAPPNDPHMGMNMDNKSALSEIASDAQQMPVENLPELKLANFTLTKPESWTQENPSSAMRIVQYACGVDNNIKVVGFFFGQQDMIRENIDRWKGEFVKVEKANESKLSGDKVAYVEIEGAYRVKEAPMSDKFVETPGYMTLAAIVPSAEGPYYFKVNGPAASLKKEIDNFKKFVGSYKTN